MTLPEPYQAPEHQPFFWRAENTQRAALLIHGFPGTPAEMRPLAEILHADGWSTHGSLLPGFGAQSKRLALHSHADWLRCVREGVRELQQTHKTVMLVGLSMGGALAIQAAAQMSPSGLLLLAPFWRIENRWLDAVYPVAKIFLRELYPFKDADFSSRSVRREMKRIMPSVNVDDPQTQQAVRQISLPTHVAGAVRRAGRRGYRAAPQVAVPTLVIQGTRDDVVLPSQTHALANRIPSLQNLVEVDADHQLTLVRGDGWPNIASAVRQFAQSLV